MAQVLIYLGAPPLTIFLFALAGCLSGVMG
jgi:hypothetical protein